MAGRKTRIWTGVGADLLAGAGTAVIATQAIGVPATPAPHVTADAAHAPPAVSPLQLAADPSAGGEGGERGESRHETRKPAGEGGEGGEGGERGESRKSASEGGEGGEGGEAGAREAFAGLSPRTEVLARLFAMKGHLRAGRDLTEAGDAEHAKQHFAHPLSEEYEEIALHLAAVGLRPFRAPLDRLVERVTAGADRTAILAALADANAAIDERAAAARRQDVDGDDFMAAVAALLRKAAAEYAGSMKDGRFANAEEYQDARGFILVLRDEIAAAKDALRRKDTAAAGRLADLLDRLAAIVPTPVPPARPVAPPSEVYGTVARAEFAVNRLK